MNSAVAVELDKMSRPQQITLVEDIWDKIGADATSIPFTTAQKEEIDDRLEYHKNNPNDYVTWNEIEKRVLAKLGNVV